MYILIVYRLYSTKSYFLLNWCGLFYFFFEFILKLAFYEYYNKLQRLAFPCFNIDVVKRDV